MKHTALCGLCVLCVKSLVHAECAENAEGLSANAGKLRVSAPPREPKFISEACRKSAHQAEPLVALLLEQRFPCAQRARS